MANYLVFISIRYIYLTSKKGSDSKIESWKSTEMLEESIEIMHPSDISLAPKLIGDYQFKKVEYKTSEPV